MGSSNLFLVKEVSPCTPPPRSSSLFSSPELTPPCWRHQLLQILRKANLIIVIPDQLCPRLDVGGCEECNPGEPQIVTVHLGKGTFFWISRFSKSGIAVLPSKTSISQQQKIQATYSDETYKDILDKDVRSTAVVHIASKISDHFGVHDVGFLILPWKI